MKTIEIHPLSAALGATFVGLTLLTLGFSPAVSSCSSSSSGGTTTTTGFGGGEEPYDVTVLNDLTIESMPSVDISSLTSIRVKGIPTHEDFVVIEFNDPYTVPAGKVLVLTGTVNKSNNGGRPRIMFDGVEVMHSSTYVDFAVNIAPGLHANSGVIVEALDTTGTTSPNVVYRLLGYLEEA